VTLKQVFIQNLKEFRKKEGFSQMKFAECCDTTTSYIGHIETGRKFPSMDMIERMAHILRIEPYHFFINRTKHSVHIDTENVYPKLPKSMKNEIKNQMDLTISGVINEILSKY
jgi:transcriptional regulator with XRE-family HTH domain